VCSGIDSGCDRHVDSWTVGFERTLGGHFANLASTLQLSLRFSLRYVSAARIAVGLDWVWRSADARLAPSLPLTHVA